MWSPMQFSITKRGADIDFNVCAAPANWKMLRGTGTWLAGKNMISLKFRSATQFVFLTLIVAALAARSAAGATGRRRYGPRMR